RRMPKPVEKKTLIKLGAWSYDPKRDELKRGNETVRLTDMEAGLMRLLAAKPGTALSREALAESGTAVNDRGVND
ncbi:hypothetical protein ACSTG3_23435, partial [Vibrio parahaemolyticus]